MKNSKGTKIVAMLLVTSAIIWGVACSKGGGSSGVLPYGAGINGSYGQGCTNCFANPSLLLAGVRSSTGGGEWLMSFDVLGSGMMPMNGLISSYSGPVALQGAINVVGQLSGCMNVAPGTYQVQTMQAGQMMMDTISGVVVQAIGPGGTIVLRISTSELYNVTGVVSPYDTQNNRIGINGNLDFVNGQPCGPISTY